MKFCILQEALILFLISLFVIILGFALNEVFLGVIGVLGVITEVIRLVQRFFGTPTLEFERLYVNNESTYFLRVRKSKGQGRVEACEGFLYTEGTDINNFPTIWSHGNTRRYDIGIYMDLILFKVEEEHYEYATLKVPKSITFYKAKLTKGFTDERRPYSKFAKKKLIVKITAKTGDTPTPFTKKIADIIEEAKPETSLDKQILSKYRVVNND